MTEEDLKKIIKEEFVNEVMENIDSTLIFTYIDNLEKNINIKNEEIEKLNKIIDKMAQELINAPIRICKGDLFKYTNKQETISYFMKEMESEETKDE